MCTRQLKAFHNPDRGRPIFGWLGEKMGLESFNLPCGKCPECLKDYYTQWATRGSRELSFWPSSLFITLTYNDENLPKNQSLNKKHIQDFIKRIKRKFNSTKENPIRQTYCGEYGTKNLRPHYHAILYNLDFLDKKKHYLSDSGHQVFTSKQLSELWTYGHSEFGYATPASIAYLYKYILKKKTRKEKLKPLSLEIDGITYDVEHEFIESSRNPGIGAFFKDSDSFRKGYLTVNGQKTKIPKYFMEHLKNNNLSLYTQIKDSNFDFNSRKEYESSLRKKQKEEAQKLLTDTKKKM